MSKKQAFINYVSRLFGEDHVQAGDIPDDAWDYWKALTAEKSTEKPPFTENGKIILRFFKDNQSIETWKTKDVAEALGLSSGSSRKLVTDGYLEKVGSDPVFYTLTEKGKKVNLDEE